jgi:hypothetical protein
MRHPGAARRWRAVAQRRRAGERNRHPENFAPLPETNDGGAHRRARFAALDPTPKAIRGGKQRRVQNGMAGEFGLGALHLALLIIVRIGEFERGASRIEDPAALDDALIRFDPKFQALECGRKLPGIDQRAVDGGLPPDRLQPRSIYKGMPQRVV